METASLQLMEQRSWWIGPSDKVRRRAEVGPGAVCVVVNICPLRLVVIDKDG